MGKRNPLVPVRAIGAAGFLSQVPFWESWNDRFRPIAGVADGRLCWQPKRMSEALQIVATDVLYYHDADERAFFEWLDRMDFVSGYYGVVRDLFVDFSRFPTEDDLWEVIGFCRRYGIDMRQLQKFETVENSAWMRDPTKVWCTEIFVELGNANAQ